MSSNPKDQTGIMKVPLRFIPPVAIMELGRAMRDGTRPRNNLPEGYGPFNWRITAVDVGVYYEAMQRHQMLWFEGQDRDLVSGAHHLGHVMACCAIILDGSAYGNTIDTRPPPNLGVVGQLSTDMDPFTPDWMKPK